MWKVITFSFLVISLAASLSITGCQISRSKAPETQKKTVHRTSRQSSRDWLDRGWLAAIGNRRDTLMYLKAQGSNLRPVGVLLNTNTGRTKRLQGISNTWIYNVAYDPLSGYTVISAHERLKPNTKPTRGIWQCTPGTQKVRMTVSLGYDQPTDMIWSPSGSTLAAWLYLGIDIDKHTQWFIPPNSRKGPEPQPHPVPCVIDMKTRSVKRLNCTGYPIGWSADSKTLYIGTNQGTVRYNLINDKMEKTPYRSPAARIWVLPESQHYFGLIKCGFEHRLDVVEMDNDMKRLRVIGSIKEPDNVPVISPDKMHFAYRSGERYYLFSVKDGRVQTLGKVKGNMGPAWLDNKTLAVGRTSGELSVLSLNGGVRKTYHIGTM